MRATSWAIWGGLTCWLAGCELHEPLDPPTTATVSGVWAGVDPPRRLGVAYDGRLSDVTVAGDGTFVLRDVPPGDHVVHVVSGATRGRVTLAGLQAGERAHLNVAPGRKALQVTVAKRVSPTFDDPLVIDGNDIEHRLPRGEIDHDVLVYGNDVLLTGSGQSCDDPRRTILYGRLLVDGNDVTVEGIDVRGSVHLSGNDVHVELCDP